MAKNASVVAIFSVVLFFSSAGARSANLDNLNSQQSVQLVYIGLLGRAADLSGLNYWLSEIASGALSINDLRFNVVNFQPEYLNGLGRLSRSSLVTALYSNLFSRGPDPAGFEYWVAGGGSSVPADSLVLALINGAQTVDQQTLLNKAEVASYYTTRHANYVPAQASAVIALVGSSTSSVTDGKSAVDNLSIDGLVPGVFDSGTWDAVVFL